MVGLVAMMTGCQNWPQSKRMMQYQIESERLLSEFRAQKKRADELEGRNQVLVSRLSESEKMLARMQNSDSSSRLAARPYNSSREEADPQRRSSQLSKEFQKNMSQARTGNDNRREASNPPAQAASNRSIFDPPADSGDDADQSRQPIWRALEPSGR